MESLTSKRISAIERKGIDLIGGIKNWVHED